MAKLYFNDNLKIKSRLVPLYKSYILKFHLFRYIILKYSTKICETHNMDQWRDLSDKLG